MPTPWKCADMSKLAATDKGVLYFHNTLHPHEHHSRRTGKLLRFIDTAEMRRVQSDCALCTTSHQQEIGGTLLDDAERIYYGFISHKFTTNEFMHHARNLKCRDPESYEYLIWLGKRWMWPFVQGDILRPNVEKWHRIRIFQTKKKIANLLWRK